MIYRFCTHPENPATNNLDKRKGKIEWTYSHGVSYLVSSTNGSARYKKGMLLHKRNSHPLDRSTSLDLFKGL